MAFNRISSYNNTTTRAEEVISAKAAKTTITITITGKQMVHIIDKDSFGR